SIMLWLRRVELSGPLWSKNFTSRPPRPSSTADPNRRGGTRRTALVNEYEPEAPAKGSETKVPSLAVRVGGAPAQRDREPLYPTGMAEALDWPGGGTGSRSRYGTSESKSAPFGQMMVPARGSTVTSRNFVGSARRFSKIEPRRYFSR